MQLTHSLDQKQLDIQVRNPISRMKREQTNLFFFSHNEVTLENYIYRKD